MSVAPYEPRSCLEEAPDPAALAVAAVHGSLWLGAAMLLTRVSGCFVSILLARLVAPEHFGLLGMANVALGALAMLNELGLGPALVQRRRAADFQAVASTAFWSSVVVGWGIVALNAACAPLAAAYFRDAGVTPVLRVMGLQLGINALGAVHHALLARELDYRRKLLPDALPALVSGAVAVWGALHGWGVWCLVVGAQIGAVAGLVAVWRACPWRPRLIWDVAIARGLLRFGKHIVGTELLRFLSQNIDYLVVGRLFGAGALGVYTLAYNLANLVVTSAGTLIAQIAFPWFSRLQDDPARLRRAYIRLAGYLALLSLPVMTGLCLLANEIVTVVYGARWRSAILPLQIMTVLGAVRGLAAVCGPALRAVGRPDLLTRLGLVMAPLTVLATLVGSAGGLAGVAVGETVVMLVTGCLLTRAVHGLLGLKGRELCRGLAAPARAVAIMAPVVLAAVSAAAAAGVPSAARLSAGALLGALTYACALGQERRARLSELRRIIGAARTLRAPLEA